MKFSVVLAAWNEGTQIGSYLKRLRQISQTNPLEIILVDGKSSDDTVAAAKDWVDALVQHERVNWGEQFDAGAKKATGDLLFFLRADAQPPGGWQHVLEHFWLAAHETKIAGTAFTIDYGAGAAFRLASRLANSRVRWQSMATMDHGLCTTPDIYRSSGGFPPSAYRADFGFCERLKRLGEIALLPDRIWPAARRLHRVGPIRSLLQESWLDLRWRLGASPDALWRAYCR